MKKIDKEIKELRKKTRNAETIEECYFYFEQLDKTQRLRFEKFGKFLPHSNGLVYAYSESEDLWLKF